MEISGVNNQFAAFGSRKSFKRHFKKCSYSGVIFKNAKEKSIEHILPVSQGGKNDYSNYLVVSLDWNMKRSSKPLDEFIKENPEVKENIIASVNAHDGDIYDGVDWAKEVKKTLLKVIGYDIFRN